MSKTVELLGEERVRNAFKQLSDAAQRSVLAKTANDVKNYVEQQADTHTKEGALFRSVYIKKINEGFEVGHDERIAPHAKFVHWGTKPHVIKPKNKKALRFVAGGKFAFAKAVNHPGYIGHPWLVHALERVAPVELEKNLTQAINAL